MDVGNKSLVTNDNEEVILEEGKIGREATSKQMVIVHQGANSSQEKIRTSKVITQESTLQSPKRYQGSHHVFWETRKKKPIDNMNTTKVSIPYLVGQVGLKVVSINDMLHILMELKYMLLLLLNLISYYTLFKL